MDSGKIKVLTIKIEKLLLETLERAEKLEEKIKSVRDDVVAMSRNISEPEVEAAQALLKLGETPQPNGQNGQNGGGKAKSINKRIHNVLQSITSRLQYVDKNLDNFSRTLTRKKKAAEVLFDFQGPGKRAVAKSRRRR